LAQIIDLEFISKYLFVKWYLLTAILLLSSSIVVALLSFIPKLKQITPTFNFKQETHNYLYFNHLKDKKVSEVVKIYKSDHENIEPFHEHLAEQIITNARITKRKYDYFSFACWLTLSGIVTPLIAGIYAIYTYKND